jgi:hypothetical protein
VAGDLLGSLQKGDRFLLVIYPGRGLRHPD